MSEFVSHPDNIPPCDIRIYEEPDAVHYGLGRDDVYQDVHRDVHLDFYQERAGTIICLIKENPKIRQQRI